MRSRRGFLAAAAGLGVLGLQQVEPAVAATFQVSPINLTLAAAAPSTLLAIINESTDVLRFQLTAFAWEQGDEGQAVLSDTDDIIFFPSLLSVPAGEQRNVRIGSSLQQAASERTYRLFVEELPSMVVAGTRRAGTEIRVLTRMSIPIFMTPPTVTTGAEVANIGIDNTTLAFALRNTGNVHLVPGTVQVRGINAAGKTTFQRATASGYVLAGGQRTYTLEVSGSERCATTGLVIQARNEDTSVETKVDIASTRLCSAD
jgi:fimbrial chaperone protein